MQTHTHIQYAARKHISTHNARTNRKAYICIPLIAFLLESSVQNKMVTEYSRLNHFHLAPKLHMCNLKFEEELEIVPGRTTSYCKTSPYDSST